MGREAGPPSFLPGKGIWGQPGPMDKGLRPESAAGDGPPFSPGSSLRPFWRRWARGDLYGQSLTGKLV